MLTNLFITLGWSRDDLKWFWLQIVAVAGLISSNVFDVPYWMAYLGIPLSPKALHWIFALVALVLWLAGKYDSSSLPSGPAMKSGAVPTSPASIARTGAAVVLACVLAGAAVVTLPACGGIKVATGVSPVADVANAGGKIEDTGHLIFTNAVNLHNVSPTLVTQQAEDDVAIAINKLGHIGLTLNTALGAYNAAKAAGSDLAAARAAVQAVLATIESAMADVGKALPAGTLQTIDQLVNIVLTVVAQVKIGVGL